MKYGRIVKLEARLEALSERIANWDNTMPEGLAEALWAATEREINLVKLELTGLEG